MVENIGIGARLRAAAARALAALASLFHRAERWSQGGLRAAVALAAVLMLVAVAIVGIAREAGAMGSRASAQLVGAAPHGGPAAAKPAGKPEGAPVAKPGGEPVGKPAGKPEGGPVGKPAGKPKPPPRVGDGAPAQPASTR